ncbi:MAG: hypothetical protein ACTS47_01625, partial [Candidatus Hodgkinia cicadicola]
MRETVWQVSRVGASGRPSSDCLAIAATGRKSSNGGNWFVRHGEPAEVLMNEGGSLRLQTVLAAERRPLERFKFRFAVETGADWITEVAATFVSEDASADGVLLAEVGLEVVSAFASEVGTLAVAMVEASASLVLSSAGTAAG